MNLSVVMEFEENKNMCAFLDVIGAIEKKRRFSYDLKVVHNENRVTMTVPASEASNLILIAQSLDSRES